MSVGSLSSVPRAGNSNPTPWAAVRLCCSAAVLTGEEAAHSGAAAAEAISDSLLGQAGAAPAPGALLPGLAGPSQHEKGEEDERQQDCGGGGDGGHGVACCSLVL